MHSIKDGRIDRRNISGYNFGNHKPKQVFVETRIKSACFAVFWPEFRVGPGMNMVGITGKM